MKIKELDFTESVQGILKASRMGFTYLIGYEIAAEAFKCRVDFYERDYSLKFHHKNLYPDDPLNLDDAKKWCQDHFETAFKENIESL